MTQIKGSPQKLVVYPDKRLREPCLQVTEFNTDLEQLFQDMVQTMYLYRGAGLAAIQIGMNVNMFIIDGSICNSAVPLPFINPVILEASEEKDSEIEGCLSFPSIKLSVERSLKIKIKAQSLDGTEFEETAEGFYARALQHEYDHLNGKLMIDFASYMKREMITKKLTKLKKGKLAPVIR